MHYEETPFKDREDAGRQLAKRLLPYRDENPIVLALPRGGVPVGYEIARALKAPLDVFIARKLGAPGRRELGIGAVAQGGVRVLNEDTIRALGIPEEYIEQVAAEETAEIERRLRLLRGDRPEPEVRRRTVILVDDGIATGVTAWAAIRALRRRVPRRLVLAVPVCAPQTAEAIRPEVDDLVCLKAPYNLMAIGFWYRDFEQVSDEEVIELLEDAQRAAAE
ncbi:MAG: phosphoribosyltransferase [Actinomycetota bacterium]|nr:phosphoribosyltransferase [Actinomycetota bacterium]